MAFKKRPLSSEDQPMKTEYLVLLKTETITELLMSFIVLSSMSLIITRSQPLI